MEKRYPRATVLRLPTGTWTIDLILFAGGVNNRQPNTFKAQAFAMDKAALIVDNQRTNHQKVTSETTLPPAPANKVRPCPDCPKMTRPQRTTTDQYPGTVVRLDGAGRCPSCYRKHRQANGTTPTPRAPKAKAPAKPKTTSTPKPAPAVTPKPFPLERPTLSRPIRLDNNTHTMELAGNGWWQCACGWDPTIMATHYIETRGEAAAAVRDHVKEQDKAA